MYAFVRGVVEEISTESVIIDVGNFGIEVNVPLSVIDEIGGLGEEIKLYTHTHVREDAFCLYGFLTKDEKNLFEKLILVNGIGPKGGLAIMSCLSVAELKFAILSGDAKTIAKANGIGSKTAQKVILDLKDKIEDIVPDFADEDYALESRPVNVKMVETAAIKEAVSALVALGYSQTESYKAVNAIENRNELEVEELLKQALKHMF